MVVIQYTSRKVLVKCQKTLKTKQKFYNSSIPAIINNNKNKTIKNKKVLMHYGLYIILQLCLRMSGN